MIFKNPVTQKRIQRFKQLKLSYYSLWILIIFYILSLGAEFLCSSSPIYIKFNNKSYFPIFKYYTEDTFLNNNRKTRPDYKKLNNTSIFKNNPDNFMLFPFLKHGPFESVDPESLDIDNNITALFSLNKRMGKVNIRKDFSIARSSSFLFFIQKFTDIKSERKIRKLNLNNYFNFPDTLKQSIKNRFDNKDSESFSVIIKNNNGEDVKVSLSTFSKRTRPPKTVRLLFKEVNLNNNTDHKIVFNKKLELLKPIPNIWNLLKDQQKKKLLSFAKKRFTKPVDKKRFIINKNLYIVDLKKHDIRFPYKPVKGHLLGIDGAGRDILARIIYGLRISLTFGILLVLASMIIGISAGALQGYFGGIFDITSQRIIEIWSAMPFLYIMILMGSVYGRSFTLLLFCYGIFNWIGISYYIRAEFLRLRKLPFVEAAKCMGIPSYKIIFRHILPNAMVPVITFFPFSLVGAIGSLAALDYLGFGLPPPTPSWGELLFQAQEYKWAWWLILYPSLALFIVMLLGVFIGDGIRNAYDPKKYTKFE